MGSQVKPLDAATLDEIRRVIAYNPDTGEFAWKIRKRGFRGGIVPGAVAGSISTSTGYRYIRIGQRGFAAHRIAVLMHNPNADQNLHVDHINGDRADNRLENLRLVPRAENMQNITAPPRGGLSKYDGVCFCKQTGRWITGIRVGGKRKHLGRFGTEEEAHAVYVAAKRQYHKTNTRYNGPTTKEGTP